MFIISNISKDLSFQCSPAVSFDNDMTEMREGGTTKGKEVWPEKKELGLTKLFQKKRKQTWDHEKKRVPEYEW